MDIPGECKTLSKDKKIVLEERRSKIIFTNKSGLSVERIKVDNCAIRDNDVKCDYLMIANETEHYVELKGSNIIHAVKQIERTIMLLSKNPKTQVKRCYVISSRCPLAGTEIQNLKKKFKKEYSSGFLVKNTHYECEI